MLLTLCLAWHRVNMADARPGSVTHDALLTCGCNATLPIMGNEAAQRRRELTRELGSHSTGNVAWKRYKRR